MKNFLFGWGLNQVLILTTISTTTKQVQEIIVVCVVTISLNHLTNDSLLSKTHSLNCGLTKIPIDTASLNPILTLRLTSLP